MSTLDQNINTQDVLRIARHLNGQSSKSYQNCFVKFPSEQFPKTTEMRSLFRKLNHIEIYRYHEFFLLIINHEENLSPGSLIQNIQKILNKHSSDYHAGISNIFEHIEQFHVSIKQAYAALDLESFENTNFVNYMDLNVYKILYPLKNSPVLREFHAEVIEPLEAYDLSGNTDLLLTCKAFLENNGDYKLIAREIHQHENTIRYRITKARSILNLENDSVKFIELLSLGFKIRNLIKS
jgi:sugar diacid utilization regulator